MPYIRTRTFCCCLPVRLGVFLLTLLGLTVGTIVAAAGWIHVGTLRNHPLDVNDQVALFFLAIMYSILAFVSLFGLFGAIARNPGWVYMFLVALGVHLGFNIASGIYNIVTLYRQNSQTVMWKCLNGATDQVSIDICNSAVGIVKGLTIAIYVCTWLLELYACVIVSNYVEQLHEEQSAHFTVQQNNNISQPITISTTYNSFGAMGQPKPYDRSNNV